MDINYALNLAQAEKLFAAEAVFMHSTDMIPEYRVIELFGDDIARWLDSCCAYDGYMKGGQDYNICGDCGSLIRFFYMTGFLKIVSKANHAQALHSHRNSEAGKLADRLSEERASPKSAPASNSRPGPSSPWLWPTATPRRSFGR